MVNTKYPTPQKFKESVLQVRQVELKVNLEQTTKAENGSKGIALMFL